MTRQLGNDYECFEEGLVEANDSEEEEARVGQRIVDRIPQIEERYHGTFANSCRRLHKIYLPLPQADEQTPIQSVVSYAQTFIASQSTATGRGHGSGGSVSDGLSEYGEY
jgi:hypothetical protein